MGEIRSNCVATMVLDSSESERERVAKIMARNKVRRCCSNSEQPLVLRFTFSTISRIYFPAFFTQISSNDIYDC